jgi:hypothetical protein
MTPLLMILLLTMLLTIPVTAFSETRTYTCIYPSYSDGNRIQKVEKEMKLIFIVDTSKKNSLHGGQHGQYRGECVSENQWWFVFHRDNWCGKRHDNFYRFKAELRPQQKHNN